MSNENAMRLARPIRIPFWFNWELLTENSLLLNVEQSSWLLGLDTWWVNCVNCSNVRNPMVAVASGFCQMSKTQFWSDKAKGFSRTTSKLNLWLESYIYFNYYQPSNDLLNLNERKIIKWRKIQVCFYFLWLRK